MLSRKSLHPRTQLGLYFIYTVNNQRSMPVQHIKKTVTSILWQLFGNLILMFAIKSQFECPNAFRHCFEIARTISAAGAIGVARNYVCRGGQSSVEGAPSGVGYVGSPSTWGGMGPMTPPWLRLWLQLHGIRLHRFNGIINSCTQQLSPVNASEK